MNALQKSIVDEALSWRGTRWHHAARVKGHGVDCAHFLIGVIQGIGLPADTDQKYPIDWHLHRGEERFINEVLRYCDEIDGAELDIGDLVMWKYGRCFSHGAIFIGGENGETVIHAVVNQGVVFSYLSDEDLMRREKRYFRHRSLLSC
jgi:cell wall-associated NlpC family hydrolase